MPKIEKYKIIYSPAALNHVANIVTWYNIQKPGLGTKFKEALKITLIKLKQNPFVNAVRYDEVRFALAQTFPYAVHYTIDNTNLAIIIHAVFAFKESPHKWE